MSAFFFPMDAAPAGASGFVAFSSGECKFYQRQEVDPLEFMALLKDSRAQRSLLATVCHGDTFPERFFTRYYREDGTDFFVGTIEPSQATYPYAAQ